MRSFRALTDLIVPSRCAGCAAPGGPWCPDCAHTLAGPIPVVRPALPPAHALGLYRGAPRRAILAYKERGRRELSRPLGRALAACVPDLLPRPPTVLPSGPPTGPPSMRPTAAAPVLPTVPVSGLPSGLPSGPPSMRPTAPAPLILVPAPSRAAAARRRGGQHMLAIADHCARALRASGVPARVAPALRLHAKARDSVGLTAEDRTANLAGRLRPVPRRAPPPDTTVLLLDDVITTGATAVACTAALASIDVRVTAVLTLTTVA